MDFTDNAKPGTKSITSYFITLIAVWTLVVISAVIWDIYRLKDSTFRLARISAEISYNKDIIYRRWVASHGGVYVPVSDTNPQKSSSATATQHITTVKGQKMILINHADVAHQINEICGHAEELQSRITSLNPSWPRTYPDSWEKKALKSIKKGAKEAASFEMKSGKEYFRFMRPFTAEKGCLKCHSTTNFKKSEIHGGISISIPMEPLRSVERAQINNALFVYGFLWLIGICGIAVGARHLWNQMIYREKIEDEIINLSITDHLTGLYNRRGFLSLAEQQLKISDRNKNGMMLFFADLDGLKDINDRIGHKEGDKALIEAALLFKETFRTSDIIARLGGDEFAALAIDIKKENSKIFTSRLNYLINRQNKIQNRKYKLSISIGSAYQDPEKPLSIDELISQADNSMYEQKKQKKFCPI